MSSRNGNSKSQATAVARGGSTGVRHKQRGSGSNNHRSSYNSNGGPGRYERHNHHSQQSAGRSNGNLSQYALDQQWSLAGNAWGAWNNHQHFPPPTLYPGDFRVYGPVMPIQAVSTHGDYLFASGPSNGQPTSSQMQFYPRAFVEFPAAPRHRSAFGEAGEPVDSYGYEQAEGDFDLDLDPTLGGGNNVAIHSHLSPTQMSPIDSTYPHHSMIGGQVMSELTYEEVDYQSSEDDDDDSENGSHYQSIVRATFEKYESQSTAEDAGKISKLLLEVCQSGSVSCLICISSVKRSQPVWSCVRCCCMYHLQCIQKWARDSIEQTKFRLESHPAPALSAGDHGQMETVPVINWDCPKCRLEYPISSIPDYYYCFCGKTRDPDFDPWLVPHSCGQSCDRDLVSQPLGAAMEPIPCGHRCTLLCHPGACPPCAQTVMVRCQCGASPPEPRRCSAQIWTCSNICGKSLSCETHFCAEMCHPGPCAPCKETLIQCCDCGAKEKLTMCSNSGWKCDTICGKIFPCGQHQCAKICHPSGEGFCGECPNSGKRTCPCGATSHPELDCTQIATVCEKRCRKALSCGLHICEDLCHHGDCGPCRQRVSKRCACGKKSRQVHCTETFHCDTKCGKFRNCGRHQCKKKCCTGQQCAPCDQMCLKVLSCGNHKCQQVCHSGPCYPCQQTKCLSCPCGATSIQIPCGREKLVKKPNCQKNCLRPPACHHESQKPHKCHSGFCPPCDQVCEKEQPKCGHNCMATCHSAVWTKFKPKNLLNNETVQFRQVEQPCPPCRTQIEISCFGQHESINLQCAKAKTYSCGSPCGRMLSCGNHQCERTCHVVQTAPDESTAGADCDVCERGCELDRPEGCQHVCPLPCHRAPCPPCVVKVYKKCLCSHLTLMIACNVWTSASEEERVALLNGNHPCPLQMECGHACTRACHPPGQCLPAEQCTKRATVKCACGNIKQDTLCMNVPMTPRIPCNRICEQRLDKKRKQKEKRSESKDSPSEVPSADGVQRWPHQLASKSSVAGSSNNSFASQSFLQTQSKYKDDLKMNNGKKGSKTLKDELDPNNSKSAFGKYSKTSSLGAKGSHHGKSVGNKVPFYKRPYCVPLLLAVLVIFAGVYISMFTEVDE
ncbi:NF-X1-type zinc finger protein NFXL1-like isoform X1 [Convolutriloba macropyga]|uniref:NF-X1-type zinc finger protein NFXL1-like isoform X1 n=1 Tax=Convolutriloba macropyga TaxID=536237 RepID=UPI003F525B6D